MIPTEHEMTVAVEAAAKKAYSKTAAAKHHGWEEVGALAKKHFRDAVLPYVIAALEALPDRLDEDVLRATIGSPERTDWLDPEDREKIIADLRKPYR